ncbi:MAG: peptidoglycan -binding protein [Paracoccus sp. (in: a-proteobacteria)]|nr:peptidoglycan -binding protein [Paracoccus sp. (in: a-proteobacteria)]
MALARGRTANRFSASIWPGFVDAMTALLMVLMFVITIFMVVQSVLREQVDAQESELDRLAVQIAGLTSTLAVTETQRDRLDADLSSAHSEIAQTMARLEASRAEAEARAAALAASQAEAEARAAALAEARGEIDAQEEAARLAAARREALEALLADIRSERDTLATQQTETEAALADTEAALTGTQAALSDAEAARLVEAAAAEALRARLDGAEAELTAMTLSLERSRREAEETLTLLAAAEAAREGLDTQRLEALSDAERQAGLLAAAQSQLSQQEEISTEAQRRVALLNEQVAELNRQLSSIQTVLDAAEADRVASDLRIEDLGAQLNMALLRASQEQEQRLALEEAERTRLEQEAADLARYRSEFFGRLSQILEGREGVQVVGDRFVFSSEVLFGAGEADLSPGGRQGIAQVAQMLSDIAGEIPAEIDWIIRVDGHTDNVPLSGAGRFRDNWELSQARALAVVRYMVDDLGFPAERLAATGFAENRPVALGDSPEARAQNRRIELKLTER